MRFFKVIAVLGMLPAAVGYAAGPAPSSSEAEDPNRFHGLEHIDGADKVTAQERAPAVPLDRTARAAARASSAAVAAICSTAELEPLSGSALVNKVKTCDVGSLNALYGLTGASAYRALQESKMVSVAYGLRDVGASYPGNNSTQALQLITFLRAGYFVQFYHSQDVGPYGPALETAIRAALDAFFGSGNSLAVSDANGEVLGEAIVLVDSSTENARYLNRMIDVLNRFDNSWLASWEMRNAANKVYTVTFRGHQNADFNALIQTDQRIIDALYSFHNRWTSLLATDHSFLASNAARELARFLRQEASVVRSKVRPLARDLLARSSITGPTAPVYVGVAEMVEEYDKANCAYYGTCNFLQQLAQTVLPVSYSCSPTLRIRAQEMTTAQLASSCATQATEENRFHAMLNTGRVPVSGDLNDDLEMVIFDSSTDYQTYAGVLFDIDTNNGGIYLEGDPANPNNQARFIAYEAEWLRPVFQIWNLEHEYVHYLDGRFDMRGDFGDYLTAHTVWWLEGLAEYVAFVNDNQSAIDRIRNQPHVPLSTIFRNTYSSGADRVYRWGYFAVRFMFERHRGEVDTILGYFRNGSYAAYDSYLLSTLGSIYDSEFQTWLAGVLNGGAVQVLQNGTPRSNLAAAQGQNLMFALDVPAGATDLRFVMSGGSGDADMHVRFGSPPTLSTYDCRPYATGNNETCNIHPVQAGRYYVMLNAYAAFSGVTLTGSYTTGGGTLPECAGSDTRALGKNCKRSNRSRSAGNYDYMFILLPAGVPQLKITTSGGTGNANLYVGSSWATTSNYQYSSTGSSNNETLTIASPPAGYLYISLHAASAFSGVTISTEY